jgi:hypothetical protein
MPGTVSSDDRVLRGHFILRIQGPGRSRKQLLFIVEDVRSGEQARYLCLEDALAFIQSHLAPEDEHT